MYSELGVHDTCHWWCCRSSKLFSWTFVGLKVRPLKFTWRSNTTHFWTLISMNTINGIAQSLRKWILFLHRYDTSINFNKLATVLQTKCEAASEAYWPDHKRGRSRWWSWVSSSRGIPQLAQSSMFQTIDVFFPSFSRVISCSSFSSCFEIGEFKKLQHEQLSKKPSGTLPALHTQPRRVAPQSAHGLSKSLVSLNI